MLHYVSSKGAVLAMTRAVARELGEHDIRVNSVCPGLTLSEAIATRKEKMPENFERTNLGRALKRDQVPEDLVGVVLYLASSDSEFVTGQALLVNGGIAMH